MGWAMTIFAKIAMVLSWSYYTLFLGYHWGGQLLGLHNEIWEMYDFPVQQVSPPTWTILVGFLVSALTVLSLGIAYLSGWKILDRSATENFRFLAQKLGTMAWGLIGFWIGYNVLSGAVQLLIAVDLSSTEGFDFGWDPLDFDIIFAITGVILLAIARSLERAWLAEDEVKHFL